jgi:hypothetical protein
MVYYTSKIVLENQVFIDELNRFNSRLNSDLCSDISDNNKQILFELPNFIANAHPFIYRNSNYNSPFYGLRRDMKTAYAAHPLNVCNILLDFGFHNIETLFPAGLHDNPEELRSFKKKARANGFKDYFIDSEDDFLYLNENILPTIKEFVNLYDLHLPESFYPSVVSDVKDLTPSVFGWKDDFLNLDETKNPFFVKCADTLSVNRDPDGMVSKYSGDVPLIVGKIEERIEKINIMHNKGEKYLDKSSKERSIIMAIGDCREFLEEFIYEVKNHNGLIDDRVLKNIRRRVQRNHPYYANTSYGHNKN